MDMKLEVVVIPVSDVDRAKDFYATLGWRTDADVVDGTFRLVQMTPPGSNCSVQFGAGLTTAPPGTAQSSYLVVDDIEATRDELAARGVEVGPVFHCATGLACRFGGDDTEGRVAGAAPEQQSYASFATFRDPDGNGWLLQEITTRLPGR
jgi:catechol 2,3-dioxygenase-like lactoylglutathione lyase family enzyme